MDFNDFERGVYKFATEFYDKIIADFGANALKGTYLEKRMKRFGLFDRTFD